MKQVQRRVGSLILLALLFTSLMVSAQDDAVKVVGSGIVNPVFEAIRSASAATITVEASVTGTRTGFEQFCGGQSDVATANRAINADEAKNCTGNSIDYLELLVAHDIIAFVTSPDAAYAQCLTVANLNLAFAPSSQSVITNWNQINPVFPDTPLAIIAPNDSLSSFAVLDGLIEGDNIRADAVRQSSDADIVTAVTQTPGAIGIVSLSVASAAGESVKIIDVDGGVGGSTCAAPSAETVEQRLYPAANQLFIYVNRASLSKAGLQDVLNFAVGEAAPGIIGGLAFTPPTAAIYETNRVVLSGTGNTRPFSEASTSFSIPADANGQVTIGGVASARSYLDTLTGSLGSLYPGITFDINTIGQPAGVRRLCNGEIDIAVISKSLTPEQEQNCQANNISTLPIDLGKQVVVLVANAASSHLTCLTNEQLATIWLTESDSKITNWNQVDSTFPDQALTLFTPDAGDSQTGILLIAATGSDVPVRSDTEVNSDPLYRAAATANVEGALTYMSWQDYQAVLQNNQERIQLVGIKNGDACIQPSVETIANSTYPLTQGVQLLVNKASLTKVQVQSLLWFMVSDENFSLIEQSGFVGLNFGMLPGLRQTLQSAFVEAAVAASQAAEATPEATAEATSEATAEAPPEATSEATLEATAEATAGS
ncbi:MAG: substrate-binding domain-containing protein [Anaerolineae bacterium]|nr:substrate-binding domain-containing protein [Anaerolineae bacterium]